MNSQRILRSSFKFIPKISNFSSIQISFLYSTLSTLTQNTIDSPSIPIKPISSSSRSGGRVGLAKTTSSSKSGGRVEHVKTTSSSKSGGRVGLAKTTSSSKRGGRVGLAKTTEVQLKEDWLASLCCPLPHKSEDFGADDGQSSHQMNVGSDDWVIGIDPDARGALSLLKGNGSSISAQVFDSPYLQMLVGRKVRRRLDAKSMVQLLRSFGAPAGTTVYIEQSNSSPLDGKQSWWSGGFGFGLWIGILVTLGFSVVPVPSRLWKKKFELSSSKDDSRRVACALFPLLSSQMKRKKDHGRAEALLIAAYGKGMDVDLNSLLS